MQRADGTDVPIDDFTEAGVRWWRAFQDSDSRVDSDAQATWNAERLTWRHWLGFPVA